MIRSAEQQQRVDEQTRRLALYHYDSCWFCGRVRTVIGGLGLNIEMRDILREPQHRRTLIEQGGSSTVPCLRIEHEHGGVEWMYESEDICRFLQDQFG